MKLLKRLSLLTVLTISIVCCKTQGGRNEIILEGRVKNIPDGKVYLTDAYKWRTPVDSTESKNGHFIFIVKPGKNVALHEASISFPDTSQPAKIQQLLYRNHMRKDSMNHYLSAFFLEEGITTIEGDIAQKPFLRVYGSKETDKMYRNH